MTFTQDFLQRPKVKGITPDKITSLDRDDAVWIETDDQENIHLYISIAQPSYFVDINSDLEKRARQMKWSQYRLNGVEGNDHHMLGNEMSTKIATLLPGQERPTTTYHGIFNPEHELVHEDVFLGRVEIVEHVPPEILAERLQHDPSYDIWAKLAYTIRQNILKTEAPVKKKRAKEKITSSETFVETMMLFYGNRLSSFSDKNNILAIYRNCLFPQEKDHYDNYVYAKAKNLNNDGKLLDFDVLSKEKALSSARAFYSTTKIGHMVVNHQEYGHRSSPIRRYPDLVSERLLVAYFLNEQPPFTQAEVQQICYECNVQAAQEKNRYKSKNQEKEKLEYKKRLVETLDQEGLGFSCRSHSLSQYLQISLEDNIQNTAMRSSLLRLLKSETGRVSDRVLLTLVHLLPKKEDFWEPVKDAVLTHLEQNPVRGLALMHQSCLVHKDWEDYKIRDKEDGAYKGKQLCAYYKGESVSCREVTLLQSSVTGTNVREFWEDYIHQKLIPDRGSYLVSKDSQGQEIKRVRAGLWNGSNAEKFLKKMVFKLNGEYQCDIKKMSNNEYIAQHKLNGLDIVSRSVVQESEPSYNKGKAERNGAYHILKTLHRQKIIPKALWEEVSKEMTEHYSQYKKKEIVNDNEPKISARL